MLMENDGQFLLNTRFNVENLYLKHAWNRIRAKFDRKSIKLGEVILQFHGCFMLDSGKATIQWKLP
jgi:hypothetical protein